MGGQVFLSKPHRARVLKAHNIKPEAIWGEA